jgi:tetratricopeptide (TPR) repeat protein
MGHETVPLTSIAISPNRSETAEPRTGRGDPDGGRPRQRRAPQASSAKSGTLVILICLLAAACASAPAPRPLSTGFGAATGVADPYADGKHHLEAGRYELAAERFGQALARDRRSLDALNGLAVAYTRLGRFDSAQSQFERALQLDPSSALTLNNYGWSLLEQGRLREARAFFELARRHATPIEAPVIVANLEALARARPPALVAALEQGSGPQTPRAPHRLVRVDANAYRLETTAEPLLPPPAAGDAPPPPAALQQGAAASGPEEQAAPPNALPGPPLAAQAENARGAAPAAAELSPPAKPRPEVASGLGGAGPIRLWPRPASKAEAGSILEGEGE